MNMATRPAAAFEKRLGLHASRTDAVLRSLLSARPLDNEIERPARLMEAMRHGVLNGGKRLRPFLVLESTALLGGNAEAALDAAAALECVHCYSLIHDDLPAMDDDDLRRGQPTVHRAFDEATAILAGDSLLTLAFDIVASSGSPMDPAQRVRLIGELARAAGCGGMAGGQMLDLAAASTPPAEDGIIRLQAMKTGALIRFACRAGAIVSNASDIDLDRLTSFGETIGLAFQIADDLLDLSGDAATLGKAAGKDAAAGKATLVSMHGADWAKRQLNGLMEQAQSSLAPYEQRATPLLEAAEFIVRRDR